MARSHPLPDTPSDAPLPQLSWRSFLFALAVTLAIFFGLHPMWKPMDMTSMDRNIAWSYAPIPLLVAGLLALEHKLRWSTFFVETVRLTLVKFVLTFLFANIVWAVTSPPAAAAPLRQAPSVAEADADADAPGHFQVIAPPPATPLDPAHAGRLQGLVTDAAGAPLADAFVAVTGGLKGLVFAAPHEPVVLTHDDQGLQADEATCQVYQPLLLRGVAGAFHTVSATDAAGKVLFNRPLVSDAQSTLMFHRPLGRVTLRCSVHGQSDRVMELMVVGNPFHARTGADGRFALEGVPAGDLELTVTAPDGRTHIQPVSLHPGEARDDLRLALP